MALIWDFLKEYDWKGYGRIYNREKSWNGYYPSKATYDFHRFKSSQSGFECTICENKYPKKSKYIGKMYAQICINCAGEWFKNSGITLNQIKESLKHNAEILYKNKKKWEDEMVLNSL